MSESSIHNPDRFMVDLRQILSQGRKRIGLLVGGGAPASVYVNGDGGLQKTLGMTELAPANVYFGRGQTIPPERERIKRNTIQ